MREEGGMRGPALRAALLIVQLLPLVLVQYIEERGVHLGPPRGKHGCSASPPIARRARGREREPPPCRVFSRMRHIRFCLFAAR